MQGSKKMAFENTPRPEIGDTIWQQVTLHADGTKTAQRVVAEETKKKTWMFRTTPSLFPAATQNTWVAADNKCSGIVCFCETKPDDDTIAFKVSGKAENTVGDKLRTTLFVRAIKGSNDALFKQFDLKYEKKT
jgi:hypothetical protein